MGVVEQLRLVEQVELDQVRLGALYTQLGEQNAESVVARAMEELASRLAQCRAQWNGGKTAQLRKNSRSLIAISEQIGMYRLAQVAADVTSSIDARDDVAVAATLARLMRTGERSLSAVWKMEDQRL
ncbi:hypothetical protein KDD17_16390 [Sulfitobacter albidus]|uniref:Uncharacterized protein n=1 Tax=Sulfitobacter albidus TaxID=2829501 RepID=A0A975JDH6_9RHOB|nr:hypothetical protein [Sulfitobacter albidus]QUJ76438.1 hypothetical protein KDD17_16390 [Sulfitobacter albidus]